MTRGRVAAITMLALLAACSSSPESPRGTGSSSSSASAAPTGTGPGATGTGSTRPTAGSTAEPSANPSKTGKETAPSLTGIEGSVMVHPDCYYASTPCDVPSYTLRDGDVQAKNAQGRVVGRARTNSSGAYRMLIGPGRYTLTVTGGNAPTWNEAPVRDCRSKTVTVVSGRLADGSLECRY